MASEQPSPAFTLLVALLSQGLSLRPETDADMAFLMRLYASTREQELAQVPWSAAEKQAFLAQQFQAQRKHYRSYFADSAFDVIEDNGEPAGRLYLQIRQTQLHIIDISLLSDWRRRGIGTAILKALQSAGAPSGQGRRHYGGKTQSGAAALSPARLQPIADHGVYLEMEWVADAMPAGLSFRNPHLDTI